MTDGPRRYGAEETRQAITKGQIMVDLMSSTQRDYLLGVLMGKFIVDGESQVLQELIKRVMRTTR